MNILKLLLVYITLVSIYQCCVQQETTTDKSLLDRYNESEYVITGEVIAWSEISLSGSEFSKLWLGGDLRFWKECFPTCLNGSLLIDGFKSDTECGPTRFAVGAKITIFANEDESHPGLLKLVDSSSVIEGELDLEGYSVLTCSEPPRNCSQFESAEILCLDDKKVCPDGTTVGRDSENNCEFLPCAVVCTVDVMMCSDGSSVGRDPTNNCEFLPCSDSPVESSDLPEESSDLPEESSDLPEESSDLPEESSHLPEESSHLPEESSHLPEESSDLPESSAPECEDSECPTGHTIPEASEDVCEHGSQECGDGIYVGRNPEDNCEFFDCLNSSDCIYGTKRFGGYCACWSGAFGKTCTMGTAKVGTEVGSIIGNAFSSSIRDIEDMYYKIDFDLMLGKAFLRNFTGHPSCPEGSWEKVDLLETNGVPLLESASFLNGSLNLQVSQPMVDGRADGAVFLNDDDIDSGMHVDCYYPRSDFIEKSVEECRDIWTFSIPWSTAKTCGWKLSSEETHVVYRGQVIIHNMEWLQIKQWRIIRSVLRLKMRFQRFVRVECDTTTFNEKILTAAITRQIVAIQLEQPALIELTTILNYPYKLFNGNLTKYPTENITRFEFSAGEDCAPSEGDECVQTWRTNLHLSENTCRLDGDYAMSFTLGCAESIADNECPQDAENQTVISYRLRSEDFCAEISVDVGLYGYMLCFDSNSYQEHTELFTVGQRAYFLVKINSDLNPRNDAGELDADSYDENSATIVFSSVSLVTVTLRYEQSGEIIRLYESENSTSSPDNLGTELILETESGANHSSNAIAFSFVMSRELLKLKQNSRTKITISAEIEVHFDDQTSKRYVLASKSDRSTLSTTPEVEDDGHGPQADGKDGSLATVASLFLIFLLYLF